MPVLVGNLESLHHQRRVDAPGKELVMSHIEYVIWGRPPGEEHEQPLYTKATTRQEAEDVIPILEEEHGCTACRIHELDLSVAPDFTKAVLA
jgi:hypothetical protein